MSGTQPDGNPIHRPDDHRYWDGAEWTDHVADAGVAGTDPFEATDTAPDEGARARKDRDPLAASPRSRTRRRSPSSRR